MRTLTPEPIEILSGKAGVEAQFCTTLGTGEGTIGPQGNGHKARSLDVKSEEKRSGIASPGHQGEV